MNEGNTNRDTRRWSCAECEQNLSEYREGTLTPERAAAMRLHLGGCATCAALHALVGAAMEQLQALPEVEPPAHLRAAILARTSGMMQPSGGRLSVRLRAWRAMSSPRFALGLAMSVFAFSLFLNAARINLRQMSVAELTPATLASNLQRQFGRTWARGVSYYHDLRVVVEIEAAVHQMQQQSPAAPTATPSGHDRSQNAAPRGALMAVAAPLMTSAPNAAEGAL